MPATTCPRSAARAGTTVAGLMFVVLAGTVTATPADPPGSVALIRRHYDRLLEFGTDTVGRRHTRLWLACIDIDNGGLPERPYPATRRAYREITSPNGSNLYWQQPELLVARKLSEMTGDTRYREAADAYVRDFLRFCVSRHNGLFLWGNHWFYDVVADTPHGFSGSHHEARPLPVAWQLFWEVSPEATESAIRAMAVQHVRDPRSGLFDRHGSVTSADPPTAETSGLHAFLEAGGVLVESLAWLADRKGGDPELEQLAAAVARFSHEHRGDVTELLRNEPVARRWDYRVSTTEVGLWAGCLLHAADGNRRPGLASMARDSVAAWLRHGYDESSGRYFGMLDVATGDPVAAAGTEYAPTEYSEIWEPLFPTHNYPLAMAEACVSLWQRTGDPLFRQGAHRWAGVIEQSLPAGRGRGGHAEIYGRCIHFLARAAEEFDQPRYLELAKRIADDAIARLYSPEFGMFRSHPGENRCDAVDGVGILFAALIRLETGSDPELMGFHY